MFAVLLFGGKQRRQEQGTTGRMWPQCQCQCSVQVVGKKDLLLEKQTETDCRLNSIHLRRFEIRPKDANWHRNGLKNVWILFCWFWWSEENVIMTMMTSTSEDHHPSVGTDVLRGGRWLFICSGDVGPDVRWEEDRCCYNVINIVRRIDQSLAEISVGDVVMQIREAGQLTGCRAGQLNFR